MKSNARHAGRIAEEAAEWLIRLEEDLTPRSREEFVAWLKHSPAHMDEFLLVTCAYRAMRGLDPGRSIDVTKLLEHSAPAVLPLQSNFVRPGAKEYRRRAFFAGLAAACALIAFAGWWAMPFFNGVRVYSTTVGEQRTVKLAEGSVVYLNTQSRIRARLTQTTRDIQLLDGEALFVVERDPTRPFRVLAGSTVVQAVGTQFNVYRRIDTVKVSVIEGRVQVSAGAGPSPLDAGEEADITTSGQVIKSTAQDAVQSTAWRQRQLVFHARPLVEIAEEFNRYNKLQLRVEGRALTNRRVTGVFNADSPAALLKFLRSDADLRVERLQDTVIIRTREGR